jgi:sulfite reductase (NADPH) hemoprotein beta-component
LADQYSFGMVRVTHRQNLVLADVPQADLFTLWQQLDALQLATPNIGKATDMICCPALSSSLSLINAHSASICFVILASPVSLTRILIRALYLLSRRP